MDGEPQGEWILRTDLGEVDLRIPDDAGFDVDAETGDGSVHADFALERGERIEGNTLRGGANGGGPLLWVRTNMGGIAILER